MWFYVWDKAVRKILEWENSDVWHISTKDKWVYPKKESETAEFNYTGADQHWTAPDNWSLTIECWGAWAIGSKWWYAKGTIQVSKWDKFSIVCWSHWNNWGTYWFNGTSNYSAAYNGWWLAWVFTWEETVWVNDAARALVIWWWAGWDWASSRRWWAWGWETWGNWAGWGCGWIWGWWGQTWKSWTWAQWSWQFKWWGPSGTYGSWGWAWWYGWNWNTWDGSAWDDCAAWGWSWYVIASATDRVLTQGWGSNTSTAWKVVLTFLCEPKIAPAQYISEAWAYHNPELWVISISGDGENWVTISDKNVWATSNDPTDTDSYWDTFQYWNNYPFHWEGFDDTIDTSSTQVDASTYWPWNYYSSSTFIIWNNNWSSSQNNNLWGWVTWTVEAEQWPCASWFHIPSRTEWSNIVDIWTALWWWSSAWNDFSGALKLPFWWQREQSDWSITYDGVRGRYVSCSYRNATTYWMLWFTSSNITQSYSYYSYWFSLRPFKNTPVTPTSSWTKLYWTSIEAGWIFWNKEDWLISLSSDGSTWVTIADKNLWATQVWNSGDWVSEANAWKYFQRWNNYGFLWAFWTSNTIPNLNWYEWGNPYKDWVYRTNMDWLWWNDDLWKWVAFSNLLSLRKWPCQRDFHVPTQTELQSLLTALQGVVWEQDITLEDLETYLLMPHPQVRKWNWSFSTDYIESIYGSIDVEFDHNIELFSLWWGLSNSSNTILWFLWLQISQYSESSELNIRMWAGLSNTSMYVRPFRDRVLVPTTQWTRLWSWGPTVRIPLSYQEVEYIEGSWTDCWINTWITPHDTNFFEIEFKMNPTALKSSGNYFYWTNSSWAWNSFEYTSNNSSYWNVWSSTLIWTLSPNLSTWTDYVFDCKYNWNNWWTLTVSWTYSKSVNYSWSTWTASLYFFCAWGGLGSQSAEKLYYLKIYTWDSEANKTLVRDFVPCYRKSDNVIWLYDLANDVFYTNAGTWTFNKWSDVNSSYYQVFPENSKASFRYLKFYISAVKNSSNNNTQMSEFEICDSSWTKMARPSWTTITVDKAWNANEWIDKIIDGSTSTKYCTNNVPPITITIDFWETVDFSTYCKYKRYTANDYEARDPNSWTISLSNDWESRTEVSNISNANVTSTRYALAWTWDINLPS